MSEAAASDRYALAVVAWELLTGGRPFNGDTIAADGRWQVGAGTVTRPDGTTVLPFRRVFAVGTRRV